MGGSNVPAPPPQQAQWHVQQQAAAPGQAWQPAPEQQAPQQEPSQPVRGAWWQPAQDLRTQTGQQQQRHQEPQVLRSRNGSPRDGAPAQLAAAAGRGLGKGMQAAGNRASAYGGAFPAVQSDGAEGVNN